MLTPFFGEFLINPVPLELGLNFCSHKCAYCFANLNKPKRKISPNRVHLLLDNLHERETLQAYLLRKKYPVCVSNVADPFAATNYKQFLPMLEKLVALGIPVQIQTRGGRGVDEALSIMRPSVWYVSICSANDDIRAKIEPGAPSIYSRFVLIQKLIEQGHGVVVGINPAVPEWLPDYEGFLETLSIMGVWGVWVERLHLNYRQIRNLSPREADNLGKNLITRARKRYTHKKDMAFFHALRESAMGHGLEVYSLGQPNPSQFFEIYRRYYSHTFPVYQDFINALYEADYGPDDPITFEQFADFMTPHLPDGVHSLGYYLGATSRDLYRKRDVSHWMTYRELLRLIWEEPKTKYSLVKSPAFAYASAPGATKKQWTKFVEPGGLPYIVYNPQGFDWYHNPTEALPTALG